MSKKMKMNLWWALFIAIIATIYAVIYNLIPLKNPVMWVTYISMPMFFLYNGEIKEIPALSIACVCGFLWGVFCLWLIGVTASLGAMPSLIIGVFGSVLLCCGIHWALLGGTIFSRCPMLFGAFACCFATGGQNAVTVICTLFAGLLVGALMAQAGKWSAKLAKMDETEEAK